MFSINIALTSYRDTELAREIVALCCDLAIQKPGVVFSLGYGGDNKALQLTYERMINATIELGGEARLLCCPDISERVKFCFSNCSSKEWTLTLSDDDIFSTNYLRSLIDATLFVDSQTSLITAQSFLVINKDTHTKIANTLPKDESIRSRYRSFIDTDYRAISFYGVHRSANILKWFTYFSNKGYFPSYADQVLLHLEVLSGMCAQTSEYTFLTYDVANWTTFELCVHSDAKAYYKRELVLFHELFFCVDAFKLLNSAGLTEKIFVEHVQWWSSMIEVLIKTYDARRRTLNLNEDFILNSYVQRIFECFQWFTKINYFNQASYLLNCFCDLEAEISDYFRKSSEAVRICTPSDSLRPSMNLDTETLAHVSYTNGALA